MINIFAAMPVTTPSVLNSIAGDTILVPVGKTVLDSNGLFVLNELGAFLWDRLPDAKDADALLAAVLEEYEVSAEEAARDIAAFLERLRQLEII